MTNIIIQSSSEIKAEYLLFGSCILIKKQFKVNFWGTRENQLLQCFACPKKEDAGRTRVASKIRAVQHLTFRPQFSKIGLAMESALLHIKVTCQCFYLAKDNFPGSRHQMRHIGEIVRNWGKKASAVSCPKAQ